MTKNSMYMFNIDTISCPNIFNLCLVEFMDVKPTATWTVQCILFIKNKSKDIEQVKGFLDQTVFHFNPSSLGVSMAVSLTCLSFFSVLTYACSYMLTPVLGFFWSVYLMTSCCVHLTLFVALRSFKTY
jgi:hypothetical protein